MTDYSGIRPFAQTDRQREILDAVIVSGSQRKAAEALGVARNTVDECVKRVEGYAAVKGYSPQHDMTRTVPDPYVVKGVSTYYDAEGNVRGQWLKSSLDNARLEQARTAAMEALSETLPRLSAIDLDPGGEYNDDLCNLYTLTDSHVGMLAWGEETGADWDLKIAEDVLVGAFAASIESAPPARVCVVNQLGDFLHSDGLIPVTPTSGHVLDQDGRFSKVVASAIRILRRVVDMALQSHESVHLLICEGNHDLASSVWLRHMFSALYENEPRITVNNSELPYYVHQHGEVMLAFHHGHMKKNDSLPLLFAAQFPEAWGQSRRRYAHVGHRHHVEIKDHSGMRVVQHSTLAARDAYAARGGWMSDREITTFTYHKKKGQVASITIDPEMMG